MNTVQEHDLTALINKRAKEENLPDEIVIKADTTGNDSTLYAVSIPKSLEHYKMIVFKILKECHEEYGANKERKESNETNISNRSG